MTATQRLLGVAAAAAAAVAVPLAMFAGPAPQTVTAQPPGSCPPGETGAIYGCAPFCVPGKYLDVQTGLCMPVPPPPPPPAPRY
ncbi:hypothetical protein Mycch_0316 [Mycolicibacterium chubuense NBB4]|uniref:Uncharacterized protein n=1 Tax=Mycolicibacterium chubuense (strain NBB4) TaxID=710421 RepID=I4BCY3_MYCCN|nr:hypothetical protein [Mycolicibacterium chubuense]AFM15140.1 hypothetical protein Mycch_0316 [Mycolicibacterium chubuense NBB4]